MYLSAPFHSAKFLKSSWVMRMCHFWAQNGPFVLNNFFWYKPLLLLSSTCWLFSLCKIYKIFLQRIQRYEDRSFLGPKWSICSKQFFFENYSYHFHLTISPFQCAKFQKNFPADPVLWGCAIFGPKKTHLPKWEIFQKTC